MPATTAAAVAESRIDFYQADHDDARALEGDVNIFSVEDLYLEEDRADINFEEELDDGFVPEDDVGTKSSGPAPLYYNGEEFLAGLPTREAVVQDTNGGLSDNVQKRCDNGEKVLFMPHDVEETIEYTGGIPTYRLNLFGPMIDGSKAHVIVEGIDVFFDVRVPDRPPVAQKLSATGKARLEKISPQAVRLRQFDAHLRQLFSENEITVQRIDDLDAFPVFGYRLEKCQYKRVFTGGLQERKKAIAAVRGLSYETASDDRSAYYRKAAREYGFTLTEWLILSGFQHEKGPTQASPLCSHVFRVPVKSMRPLIDPMATKEVREKAAAFKQKTPYLVKDRTLVLTWDIETHSDRKVGEIPTAAHPEDHVFMICATAHWKDSIEPLAKVCFVDKETDPDERWVTVVCGTQENVIKAWFLGLRALAPDSIIGFNDSEYDWPFVIEKAHQFGLLAWVHEKCSAIPRRRQTNEGVYRWNYHQDKKIKISPEESFYSSFLKLPGYVPIDVRACFKKLYPKSEVKKGSSLNFYLEQNNLKGKADMPYLRMFKIYEAGDIARMREVAHYCLIDALRCQQLLVRRNVINDYREVSTLSFVSFGDSVLYAGGMKVCNMLLAYAIRKGMICSNITRETKEPGKYPGAWVFEPEKGLENRRPVTGLDAQSLYPSEIMTYNLSPEKILLTEEEATYWRAQGRTLHYIEFMFNGRQIRGWSIRHNGVPEDIGLFPAILIDLFAKRKEMKDVLGPLSDYKEFIELVMGIAKKGSISMAAALAIARAAAEKETETCAGLLAGCADPKSDEAKEHSWKMKGAKERVTMAREIIHKASDFVRKVGTEELSPPNDESEESLLDDEAVRLTIQGEYEKVCFEYASVDSKQKALKVYMNTFYGESGNSLSPFFLLQLAGGVTTAGQHTIKLVESFARKEGFRTKYGDSVTGDTTLVIRRGGIIDTIRIDEIVPDAAWAPYHGDKEAATLDPPVEVWNDGGFTEVRRFIRHKTSKPMKRIVTHTGIVDATIDHSLLRPNGEEVSPSDVKLKERLLHQDDAPLVDLLDNADIDVGITPGEAFAMGMFASEGSCGRYDCHSGVKYSWAINNQDLDLLEKCRQGLPFPTKVLNTLALSAVYKLVPIGGDLKGPTLKYRALFYNNHGEKRIPSCILNAPTDIVLEFFLGFYAGDGDKYQQMRQTAWRFDQKGKEMGTGLWLLSRRLGWQVALNDRKDKPDVFRYNLSDRQSRKRDLTGIKKIWDLPKCTDFVYDLETESHHFHVGPGNMVVHNTDSVYLVIPEKHFTIMDAESASGAITKEQYWTEMVKITMKEMAEFRDRVNKMLEADNGTKYLKMAYEEVLFPVVFTGKKKYFGIPHINVPNFRPKKLFVKGIDILKQGQTGLARDIGNRIMWGAMGIDNTKTIRQLVEDTLDDSVVRPSQWKFEHFIRTDAYKPTKKNVRVLRFIARMQARHAAEMEENKRRVAQGLPSLKYLYEIPEPGERFEYVYVKRGGQFDLRGLKSKPKKGDVMEFPHVTKALGMEIDTALYMESYVVGLCARFINGDPDFAPEPAMAARMDGKAIDKKRQDKAKKYLENFIKRCGNVDPKISRARGFAYRRAYKTAAGLVNEELAARVGADADLLNGDWISFCDFTEDDVEAAGDGEGADATPIDSTTRCVERLMDKARELAIQVCDGGSDSEFCGKVAERLGIMRNGSDVGNEQSSRSLFAAVARWCSSSIRKPGTRVAPSSRVRFLSALDRKEAQLRREIVELLPAVSEVAMKFEVDLERLVGQCRAQEHRLAPEKLGEYTDTGDDAAASATATWKPALTLVPADGETLSKMRRAWLIMVGVFTERERDHRMQRYLTILKNKRLGVIATPSKIDVKKMVAAAAKKVTPVALPYH